MQLPSEKQVSGIRKYIQEYVIIGLIAAVVFLFHQYVTLNNFINDRLMKGQEEMIKVVERNTLVIQNFQNK